VRFFLPVSLVAIITPLSDRLLQKHPDGQPNNDNTSINAFTGYSNHRSNHIDLEQKRPGGTALKAAPFSIDLFPR